MLHFLHYEQTKFNPVKHVSYLKHEFRRALNYHYGNHKSLMWCIKYDTKHKRHVYFLKNILYKE